MWKSAVEHHSFFRLQVSCDWRRAAHVTPVLTSDWLQSPKTPGRKFSLLGLSSRFRYSGRTEFQTVSETAISGGGGGAAKSRWERAFFR